MNREERKNQYQLLVEKGKILPLFLQPWWLDATGPWDVSLAVRNDQIIGAMPFATGKRWGIPYIGMPALTHHMQIWMDKPPDIKDHKWLTREKQIIWSLIDDLPAFGFFSMVFAENSFDNWLPFYWKGFRQEMRYTFIIDRVDEGTLSSQINLGFKQKIRKASFSIDIERGIDNESFYKVLSETFKRQGIPVPYSYELFTKIDKAVQENNAGLKFGAYTHDRVLGSVSYLLWDNTTAYYFLAGENETGRSSGAGILLCREAMRFAFEEQMVKTFDFCGSIIEPITEIRRQFGARSVPLMKIFKAKYKWLDVLYSLTR